MTNTREEKTSMTHISDLLSKTPVRSRTNELIDELKELHNEIKLQETAVEWLYKGYIARAFDTEKEWEWRNANTKLHSLRKKFNEKENEKTDLQKVEDAERKKILATIDAIKISNTQVTERPPAYSDEVKESKDEKASADSKSTPILSAVETIFQLRKEFNLDLDKFREMQNQKFDMLLSQLSVNSYDSGIKP